ncbi:hypothetical protein [Halobellus rubicundus]|uniref:AtpZ/AtpI family protein n=1 Tax=Halobellus rubicundus TaxID=2996466 RepID=A0ABD5MH97_9EURY
MREHRFLRENLGYAIIGGPVLSVITSLVGMHLFDTVGGIGCGLVVYSIGWVLSITQSNEDSQESVSDPDSERSRRENELEAEKGAFGGNGGGG